MFYIYLPSFGFALDLKVFHMKKAMAIPSIITNRVSSIGASTTTSTTLVTPKLPPSDIVLALTLGAPFACDDVYLCSIEVDGDSGDINLLCLIDVHGESNDNKFPCLVEVDGDSGGDNSVDQQKVQRLFN